MEVKLKRVVLKEELVALTGDHVKAILLQQLLYWTERVKDIDKFLEEEITRTYIEDTSQLLHHGWIYKRAEEMAEECLLTLSKNTILRELALLVEKGFVDRRSNPKMGWDKTYQYRVNISFIDQKLRHLGYRGLDGYRFSPELQIETPELHFETPELHFETAITENTTETTIKPFSPKKDPLDEKVGMASLVAPRPSDAEDTGARSARPSIDRSAYNRPEGAKRKQPNLNISDRAKIILDYWNSKDGLRKHKEGTKTYKAIGDMIDTLYNGKLKSDIFKDTKFKRQDFIEAIDQFHLSVTHLDYEPANPDYKNHLRKTSLLDFLYNPVGSTDKHKSLFFHYLTNPAQKVNGGHGAVRTRKSDAPAISILSEWYKSNAVNPNGNGSHHFNMAVQKLKDFKQLYQDRFIMSLDYWRQCYNVEDELSLLAIFLTEAIEEEIKQSEIKGRPVQLTAGWLSSDRTFEIRLPSYLSKKALIRKEYRI